MEFLAGLHPQIVHFPIALLLTYILLEIIGAIFKNNYFTNAAYIVLILGLLGAILAVLTGEQAAQIAKKWNELGTRNGVPIPLGLIDDHENFATITLWYFAILTLLRTVFVIQFIARKKFQNIFDKVRLGFVILAIIGAFFIYETGEHGSKLVYRIGVGTDLIKPEIDKQLK